MVKSRDYAVFIVTHGRPNKVITHKTLRRQGYSGDIFLIVDDQDSTVSEYKSLFGDYVIVFDKNKYIELTDDGDNFIEKRAVVYARNACFDIAETVGVKYFIVLDDDYTSFRYKMNGNFSYADKNIINLDKMFDLVLISKCKN